MTAETLACRVEEAELNALPALRQVLLGPWLLRLADGSTRRANSVTPLRPAEGHATAARVRQCVALYAAQGQPCLFRLPSHVASGLDEVLDAEGFLPAEGETRTLFRADLAGTAPGGAGVRLTAQPDAVWLAAQARLRGETWSGARGPAPRARMLAALAIPAAFAAATLDGADASLAYAAVHDGIVAINMVITDPAARRRGLARLVLLQLLDWARGAGAQAACLQVAADNPAAIAMYEELGFRTELYRYHYRRLETAAR